MSARVVDLAAGAVIVLLPVEGVTDLSAPKVNGLLGWGLAELTEGTSDVVCPNAMVGRDGLTPWPRGLGSAGLLISVGLTAKDGIKVLVTGAAVVAGLDPKPGITELLNSAAAVEAGLAARTGS